MRALAFLVLAGALLVAAGCGGGELTTQEYERELRRTMDDLEDAYGRAGAALEPDANASRSVGDVIAQLRSAQVALRDAGSRLDAIEPPSEVSREHRELVAGVRDMADAVDLLIEAQEVAERDPERAQSLARRFATDDSFERVQAAAAELSEAGVDAGL